MAQFVQHILRMQKELKKFRKHGHAEHFKVECEINAAEVALKSAVQAQREVKDIHLPESE